MIDINELRRLAQAVIEWSTCNQAWLDQNEDAVAAVVGHIDEEGNTYPVATIDCYQYISEQSLPLAKFYAAANPAAINELLDRLEAAATDALEQARLNGMGGEREAALMAKLETAEKERDDVAMQLAQSEQGKRKISEECDTLLARIEQMEKQEPVASVWRCDNGHIHGSCERTLPTGAKLFDLPGAKGEIK